MSRKYAKYITVLEKISRIAVSEVHLDTSVFHLKEPGAVEFELDEHHLILSFPEETCFILPLKKIRKFFVHDTIVIINT